MKIKDVLNIFDRLVELPQMNSDLENAIVCLMKLYFSEMQEIELEYDRIRKELGLYSDEASAEMKKLIEKKLKLHKKFWSNQERYYQPLSLGTCNYTWSGFQEIEVLQNGDDNNQLFLFKAKYIDKKNGNNENIAYLLKLTKSSLSIEHCFFEL